MKKLSLLIPLLFSSIAIADQAISEEGIPVNTDFTARSSHWVASFGFDQFNKSFIEDEKYNYSGRQTSFIKGRDQAYLGFRAGFGREFYLGAGFITRTMIEGYYQGTIFDQALNGGRDNDNEEFAWTKKKAQYFGGEISQSLGWMFDMKTKNPFFDQWSRMTIEPFVEAGIGMGEGLHKINYRWDTQPVPTGALQIYKYEQKDKIMTTRFGGGFNVISPTGFFLQIKAMLNSVVASERNIIGKEQNTGDFSDSKKNVKLNATMLYTLGGGYKF